MNYKHIFILGCVLTNFLLILISQTLLSSTLHKESYLSMFHVTLSLNNINLNQEFSIKYLGVIIDSNLLWKSQVSYIGKKIKQNIGILSKLRYFVNSDILVKLYYALIYPFLTYGLISWGNTYSSTTQPLFILQKRAMRVMTFSKFHEHSSPIFKRLNIVKLPDLVFLNIAVFMHKFHNR